VARSRTSAYSTLPARRASGTTAPSSSRTGCYIEEAHKEYTVEHADWLFGEAVDREDVAFD
jgi:hypothetical protein